MKTGIGLIAEERQRQIEKEGWTAEHDAQHNHNELAEAAVCYATPGPMRVINHDDGIPYGWPFNKDWWKPSPQDRRRELIKAGALIAAEIDRLNQETKSGEEYCKRNCKGFQETGLCFADGGCEAKIVANKAKKDATEAEEVTIEGWVARYKNNRTLGLYSTCPKRNDAFGSWVGDLSNFIDYNSFPEVTWESKPKKVKVTIKAE